MNSQIGLLPRLADKSKSCNNTLCDWYICTINEPGWVKMIKLILQLNIDKLTPTVQKQSLKRQYYKDFFFKESIFVINLE